MAAKNNWWSILTSDIYQVINNKLAENNQQLSQRWKNQIRALVNTTWVNKWLFYPYNHINKWWWITPEAKELISIENLYTESILDLESNVENTIQSNTIKGFLFEKYCLDLLKLMYPNYIWYHQWVHKKHERWIDLLAESVWEEIQKYWTIWVQIKCYQKNSSPSQIEWLKFLWWCFTRRVEKWIFITTWKLTWDQRREAWEANLIIIEWIDEINR